MKKSNGTCVAKESVTLKNFLYEYVNIKIQDNWSATADYYIQSEDSACGSTMYTLKESGVALNISENVYLDDYSLYDALWEFFEGQNYILNVETDTIIQMDEDILEALEEMWMDDGEYKERLCDHFDIEYVEYEDED